MLGGVQERNPDVEMVVVLPPAPYHADLVKSVIAEGKDAFRELRKHVVHTVSRNASKTKPAKFVVFFVKNEGAPILTPIH